MTSFLIIWCLPKDTFGFSFPIFTMCSPVWIFLTLFPIFNEGEIIHSTLTKIIRPGTKEVVLQKWLPSKNLLSKQIIKTCWEFNLTMLSKFSWNCSKNTKVPLGKSWTHMPFPYPFHLLISRCPRGSNSDCMT